LCRLLGGVGRPRFLNAFSEIAFKDSRGRSHPDGWGFAVYSKRIKIFKTLYPIWERPRPLPSGRAFLVHARRAEKLPRELDYVQPHTCNGVVLAHNGGLKMSMSYLSEFLLAKRSASERLTCLFGKLLERYDVEGALEVLTKMIKPSPSANFVALIPKLKIFVAFNYHVGDRYYIMWVGDGVVSSERLRENWYPLSENGRAEWIV